MVNLVIQRTVNLHCIKFKMTVTTSTIIIIITEDINYYYACKHHDTRILTTTCRVFVLLTYGQINVLFSVTSAEGSKQGTSSSLVETLSDIISCNFGIHAR